MAPITKKNKKPVDNDAKKQNENKVVSGQLEKRIRRKTRRSKPSKNRGVVFIKHLPHGFFEDQIKEFFEQFGKVTRLRLARSDRTGGSKGYAFVEFEFPEVAQIAAETMHNYLMFQKIVKAVYIPPEKQKFNYFKSNVRKVVNKAGKQIYVSGRTARTQKKIQEHNDWSDEAYEKRTNRQTLKLEKIKKKYADIGFDFDSISLKAEELMVESNIAEEGKKTNKLKKQPGSLLLIKKDSKTDCSGNGESSSDKEPLSTSNDSSKVSKKSKNGKQNSKKAIDIKMLLEKSLPDDDSSDEEFIADEFDIDQETESSDEEGYDIEFGKDSESEDIDDNEEKHLHKKSSSTDLNPKNLVKVNRLEQLIRRKPHLGGIQKYNKKAQTLKKNSKPVSSDTKTQLKVDAVKDLKKQGNVKEIKVTDLKLKKNKKKINK